MLFQVDSYSTADRILMLFNLILMLFNFQDTIIEVLQNIQLSTFEKTQKKDTIKKNK